MQSINKAKGRGFTLIEVVIVLAIAALIILVVLQAVSAAQRGQRDNARKQKGGQIVSYLTQYASNTNGNYPKAADLDGLTFNASPLASYDSSTSLNSYTFKKSSIAFASSGWAPAAADCSVSTTSTTVVYQASAAANPVTDYDLAVCLESGGFDVLHGN